MGRGKRAAIFDRYSIQEVAQRPEASPAQDGNLGKTFGKGGTMVARSTRPIFQEGFAADRGSLEFDSRVLGDLVLPLIV